MTDADRGKRVVADRPSKRQLLKLPKCFEMKLTSSPVVQARKLRVRWTLENPSEVLVGEDGITRYVWH